LFSNATIKKTYISFGLDRFRGSQKRPGSAGVARVCGDSGNEDFSIAIFLKNFVDASKSRAEDFGSGENGRRGRSVEVGQSVKGGRVQPQNSRAVVYITKLTSLEFRLSFAYYCFAVQINCFV